MSDTNQNEPTRAQKIEKIRECVKDIDIAMLTTQDAEGDFRSRPMSVNGEVEVDGDLWFFTYGSSDKVKEIEKNPRVNVSFAKPEKQDYVSLSGRAEVVRDQSKVDELWQAPLKAWFPDGPQTADIALLKIRTDKAEYWDAPTSAVAHAIGFAKSVILRQAPDVGENEKVDLK